VLLQAYGIATILLMHVLFVVISSPSLSVAIIAAAVASLFVAHVPIRSFWLKPLILVILFEFAKLVSTHRSPKWVARLDSV